MTVCTCSHFFRGVWVHEVQSLNPDCPVHGDLSKLSDGVSTPTPTDEDYQRAFAIQEGLIDPDDCDHPDWEDQGDWTWRCRVCGLTEVHENIPLEKEFPELWGDDDGREP